MHPATRPALLLLSLALPLPALPAQRPFGQRDSVVTMSERVAAGDWVRIHARLGSVAITEGTGDRVEFRAEKEVRRGRLEDIAFVMLKDKDGLTICAVFDEGDECDRDGVRSDSRGDGWRWGERARVTITVQLPRGVRVRASSGNGAVSLAAAAAEARVSSGNGRVMVSGVQGRVDASSGNGDITVERVSGPVNASSGNGVLRARIEKLSDPDDMTFSTGNGRIILDLPADFAAAVDARTGNGSVTTDFPVTIEGRFSPNRLRGTIGGDHPRRRLKLTSGNGSLEIRSLGRTPGR